MLSIAFTVIGCDKKTTTKTKTEYITVRPEFKVHGNDIEFIEIDEAENEVEIHYKKNTSMHGRFEEYYGKLTTSSEYTEEEMEASKKTTPKITKTPKPKKTTKSTR